MKKTWILLFIFPSCFMNAQVKNALLPNQLVIYDRIMFDTINEQNDNNPYLDFNASLHRKSIQANEFDVNQWLIDKLTDKNTDVYQDFCYNDPGSPDPKKTNKDLYAKLTPSEIKSNLGFSIDSVRYYDETSEFFEIILDTTEIDKNELKGFIFYDQWIFDEFEFKLIKSVVAWSPVRVYQREQDWDDNYDPLYRQIGFVINPDSFNEKEKATVEKRLKLFMKVEYEFLLENQEILMYKNELSDVFSDKIEKENTPFWNSYSRSKLKNIIFNRVLSGKSDAYDFISGAKLSLDEIRKRSGERIDTILVTDPIDYELWNEILVKTEITSTMNQIKSVIFIEEWFIDQKTMYIKKVVRGVIPVRWQYDEGDYEQTHPYKNKLFMVKLN